MSASVKTQTHLSPHLKALEDESIHILREVAGQCDNVALLFSGGKDSVVVYELARRAFAPAAVPFELLHIDTGHNFPEVIDFRDQLVARTGARLRVAHVQDWIDRGDLRERPDHTRNPLQTVPLVETIAEQKYDAVLGGARRDEERARAKERIFSTVLVVGTRAGSAPSCGGCITPPTCPAKTFGCFPFRIGPRPIFGSTSRPGVSSFPLFITPTSGRCFTATACGLLPARGGVGRWKPSGFATAPSAT